MIVTIGLDIGLQMPRPLGNVYITGVLTIGIYQYAYWRTNVQKFWMSPEEFLTALNSSVGLTFGTSPKRNPSTYKLLFSDCLFLNMHFASCYNFGPEILLTLMPHFDLHRF